MFVYPSKNAASANITVTNTATLLYTLIQTAGSYGEDLAGFPGDADSIILNPEDGDIRVLYDGNTPTASAGLLLKGGGFYSFAGVDLRNMRLIRAGSSNVKVGLVVGKKLQGENSFAASAGTDISLTEFPAASAASDNYANPTTTDVKSFGMVWDGSTWDRMPGTSTQGVSVTDALVAKSFADSTVSVDTSSETVLATNASRKGLYITNTSTSARVSLNITDAAVLDQGITLLPGATWEMTSRDFTTAQINGIASAAATVVSVMEIT